MSRTSVVKFGIFFELLNGRPDIEIMEKAYGVYPGHICGECKYRVEAKSIEHYVWYTCAKLRPGSEIRCEAVNPTCGKFEAETTKGEVKDSE